MSDHAKSNILNLTARIVSAHLSNNPLETDALPSLIQSKVNSRFDRIGGDIEQINRRLDPVSTT